MPQDGACDSGWPRRLRLLAMTLVEGGGAIVRVVEGVTNKGRPHMTLVGEGGRNHKRLREEPQATRRSRVGRAVLWDSIC